MNELWEVFWNSFWRICQQELRNVSIKDLIILFLIGAGIVHLGYLIYVRAIKQPIHLYTELMIILLICYVSFIVQVSLLGRDIVGHVRVFDTKLLWIDHSMDQNMTNLLNIILFIPFGTLIAGTQMNKRSLKRTIMVINYCFLLSLMIECSQYITKRGYFEIDDLEANIIGGLVGSICFSLLSKAGRIFFKNTEVKDEKGT